jgi:hypothetical protein
MDNFKERFGTCDAAGVCALSTTRQSAFTGLLSLGAIFGAVCAGTIADKVSCAAHSDNADVRLVCVLPAFSSSAST